MLRHYLVMAARSFVRHELYSFINVVGLSVALACAILILLFVLVACCNFMNLATARATLRAREVGLRKVVGAKRRELAMQFLIESVGTTLLSLAIALSLVEILLPFYVRFLDEPIGLHYLSNGLLLGSTIVAAVLVGLLSGAYPAMVLSGFRPASTLTASGVLNDAMKEGLRSAVWPVVYLVDSDDSILLSVRVRSDRLPEALSFIDRTWRSFAPAAAMQRYFMSDAFNDLFTSDERQGAMFAAFVGIAILIGCLGLFGLAVFTAERRTKEVGIRKVSGARTADIVRLVLWRISIPVLAANLIAWPAAYYFLRHWLDGYADRISLSPLYFLAAGAGALLIAWATVYANTLRLAHTRPVHALRYE